MDAATAAFDHLSHFFRHINQGGGHLIELGDTDPATNSAYFAMSTSNDIITGFGSTLSFY